MSLYAPGSREVARHVSPRSGHGSVWAPIFFLRLSIAINGSQRIAQSALKLQAAAISNANSARKSPSATEAENGNANAGSVNIRLALVCLLLSIGARARARARSELGVCSLAGTQPRHSGTHPLGSRRSVCPLARLLARSDRPPRGLPAGHTTPKATPHRLRVNLPLLDQAPTEPNQPPPRTLGIGLAQSVRMSFDIDTPLNFGQCK